MSAVVTLEAAQAAGIRVSIDGAALVIEADHAPSEVLLHALRRDKAEILDLLSQSAADEDQAVAITRTVLRPTVQAAVTLKEYGKSYGDLDLSGLVDSLVDQTGVSNDGDLKRAEAMLTTQAHTLDAIFNNLARRAINAEYIDSLDRYLKLALRAQSQCRTTWEALSAIKHPPVMGYVRQANIAQGHQQVNNAPASSSDSSRTRKNPNLQNKLLEEKDGERLDTGTTGAAGGADPAMATLGEVDRAEDPGW